MATTTPPTEQHAKPGRRRGGRTGEVPAKVAEGIDLIGEYEGSGFKEAPYIARRADGQVIQLTKLLHLVAENADGRRSYPDIAERVGDAFGRRVSADNVRFLVDKKLRPLGVLAHADGSSPELKRADPMLALKFRAALIPERVSHAITTVFRPLFWPPVLVAVLAALVAMDVWLFFVHGVGEGARSLLYQPAWLLAVFGLIVVSAGFHECGHATACRYGGGRPGVMGAGIYIVWPAFYTDVTDAYRLSKAGRLRTDLGGVYFNVVFSLLTFGAYLLTGFEPLLIVIFLQHMEIVHQFLPFLRLDGYYIISDITGVPDMFARIKPTLRSLIPGREPEDTVKELKPWVRVVTSIYVAALIPALLFMFTLLIISMPRMLATAWDSLFVQGAKVGEAFTGGSVLTGMASLLQIVSLVLPLTGLGLTGGRIGKRLGVSTWRRTEGSPPLRGGLLAGGVAAAALTTFILWPNGDYRPLQPGERGTVQGGLSAVRDIPTGRPGLTPEREAELGGAPTRRERFGPAADERSPEADRTPRPEETPRQATRERRSAEGQDKEPTVPSEDGVSEEATPRRGATDEQAPRPRESRQSTTPSETPTQTRPSPTTSTPRAPTPSTPDTATP